MATPRDSALVRGITAGLAFGCVLSAIGLGVQSVRELQAPCESTSTDECAFEADTHAELAGLMRTGALGLGLVGLGGLVFLRLRGQPPKAP